MKHMFAKYLSVLLIGALLLVSAGIAEEDIAAEVPVEENVIIGESVGEPVEEPVEEVPEEAVDEVVEAVVSEAVEAVVEEAADVELSEDVELEPESVEEVLLESPEEVVTEEPAAQAEEPAQQAVVEEPEAAAKLLAEGEELIPIDEAHFPDPAFRNYILTLYGQNPEHVGYLDQLTRESVTGFGDEKHDGNPNGVYIEDHNTGKVLWTLGATSLKGIEYFPNVEWIKFNHNPIASLDVSMMKNLKELYCRDCGMTSLNLSGCSALVLLQCTKNKLTTLDLSGCTNLLCLDVCDNAITALDITGCQYFAGFPSGFKKSKPNGICAYEKAQTVVVPTPHNVGYGFIYIHCDKKVKINGAGGATNDPTGFTETPGVTITVNSGSTAKNTKATVVAAPGTSVQLSTAAGAKKFKSSNKKVAKVNKNGVVTFKKGGKVKITYKVGKKTRKVTLTVTDPTLPTAVAITPVNTAVKKGESVTLTPTVNEGANPGGYKWKTSNKKVATVKNGVVKFKKAGKVTITCTTKRGKKKASVTFAVSK